jgi:hypothetical protein
MRIDFFGLGFETPRVSFYLWSPWRASALEHRLFSTLAALPGMLLEKLPDESCLHLRDAKAWRGVLQAMSRVLKGWEEEASEAGSEKRSWRWLLETDIDADGYDHAGEAASMWGFLRVSVDRGSAAEPEKGEDIDLHGFGLRVWPQDRA